MSELCDPYLFQLEFSHLQIGQSFVCLIGLLRDKVFERDETKRVFERLLGFMIETTQIVGTT